MPADTGKQVRLDTRVHDILQTLATSDRRSLVGEINFLIEQEAVRRNGAAADAVNAVQSDKA